MSDDLVKDGEMIPLTQRRPGDGSPGQCAEYLLDLVSADAGILAVDFDTGSQRLSIQYDASVLPAHRADEIAENIGEQLGRHEGLCILRDAAGGCQTCATSLQQGLRERDDLLANVVVAPGQVALAGADSAVQPAEVVRLIDDEHAVIRRRFGREQWRFWEKWDQNRWEITLTAATLAFILAGWIGGALGLSPVAEVALYMLAYLTGGYFGVQAGLEDLRQRLVNVDLLMVLAALGAASIGQWREGAILLFLFSLSNTLQTYAMGRSRQAIKALMKLRPEEALVRRGQTEVRIRVERLVKGDRVIVKPGERIPVDGLVAAGESAVDQSTITGESLPIDVAHGATVYAGTLNTRGALEIDVTRLASESTLARVIQLVETAQEEKARTQRFLDVFEQKYALGVIAATVLAIVIPLLLGQAFPGIFYRAMTLLVVASPCALVISTPAAILSAIANAARQGILFKGGVHLENMAGVKAIAFDKTGTLTRGKPGVTNVLPVGSHTAEELLALAAGLEARSEHPLALAIVAEAKRQGLSFTPAKSFEAVTGRGARARIGETSYLIGNRELFASCSECGLVLSEELEAHVSELEAAGKTAMLIGNETSGEILGVIAVADQVRTESKATVERLRRLGVERVVMLTGDNERVASAIAAQTGVDAFYAGLLPEDKVRVVRELAERYGSVAMVGDGVNDAPALAAANVGIAMGAAGSDVALETADVVLMADDLAKIPYVKALSRRAQRVVWQNISFALLVIMTLVVSNFLVGVPLPLGVVGHEGSTLIVVMNGLRLLQRVPG
jgi:Zn2+/Cd2+-exporting ATPase